MQIIELNQAVNVAESYKTNQVLQGDVEYVVPDAFPYFVIQGVGQKAIRKIAPFQPENFYNGEDLTGKSLFLFRNGGIGDLIFITTALKELKKKYPDVTKITLACNSAFADILDTPNGEYEIKFMPIVKTEIDSYDYILHFQGVIEDSEEGELYNAYDLIFKKMFLDVPKRPVPKIFLDERAVEKAKAFIGSKMGDRKDDPQFAKIGVQLMSSVPKRSLALGKMKFIIEELMNRNHYIFLIGGPNQMDDLERMINVFPFESSNGQIVNVSKTLKSLMNASALISQMDVVFGPDSSIIHIAGALNIPMVGVYGPFPSELRMKYYNNAIGIDSNSECEFARGKWKSCFEHGNGSCKLAHKTMDYYSPCLNLVKEVMVIDSIEKLLKRRLK